MEQTGGVREQRRRNTTQPGLDATGLYHSFVLPDGRVLPGAMTVEEAYDRLKSYGLPDVLRGKRVLDVGPWDGFYTFECERRGAAVTAVDYVDYDTFRALAHAFQSQADYRQLDVYEIQPSLLGTFDIVLLLGVLYHLKHPLLGLERVCSVTRDLCIIDTFVVDGREWQRGERPPLPYLEFYERDEMAGQLDNWCGPTVDAVAAMARTAGFATVEILKVTDTTARFAARRRWTDLPPDAGPPAVLKGLTHHLNRGRSFRSEKEEYILLWVETAEAPPERDVFVEVDRLAVPLLYLKLTAHGLEVAVRVPPGLLPGPHQARLKIGASGWSKPEPFFVDLDPAAAAVTIAGIQDGATWAGGVVDWAGGGWMTVWVRGLSAEADPGNTTVDVSGIPHTPEAVHPESGQVNVRLRPMIGAGPHQVRVRHRGIASVTGTVTVIGDRPPIKGLDALR